MEDQKPGPVLAYNLGFAKEKKLEPKVEKISKIVWVGRRGEQTSLVQMYYRGGLGADFLEFFFEKNSYLMPFGSHFAHF